MIKQQNIELMRALITRELKSRYKGSALGLLWSILTPLFMAVIYVYFFRMLIGRGVPTEGIIIGVFAWQFTVYTLNTGMMCVSGNANIIKKVPFPRALLPLSVTCSGLIDFMLSLVVQYVLIGFMLSLKGVFFSQLIWMLPFIVIVHTLYNYSLALFYSALNVYYRDTQHLVGVLCSAWFFISPIMYDLDFVRSKAAGNEWIADLFMLNPLAIIMTGYRAVMLPGVTFPWSYYSLAGLIITFASMIISWIVFSKLKKNFADYV